MYDDVFFADLFRYQLTMSGIPILIVPSQLLHAQIAYEIDTVEIVAAIFRIPIV